MQKVYGGLPPTKSISLNELHKQYLLEKFREEAMNLIFDTKFKLLQLVHKDFREKVNI